MKTIDITYILVFNTCRSVQVEKLNMQLTDLHLDKLVGDVSNLASADPHASLQKYLPFLF